MVKRNVEVKIFGQRYSLKSEFTEEQAKKVAAYVDRKMREIAASTNSVDSLHIAMLTALNIAQEYLEEKDNKKELLRRIKNRADRLEEFISLKMG